MIRTMAMIILAAVGLIFVRDLGVVYTGYFKMEKAAEQSLDAAIVAASGDIERQHGQLRLNQNVAERTVSATIQSNLNVDSHLNNTFFHSSSLQVGITYKGDLPRIEMEYRTHVDLVAGKMFGVDAWPLTVKKKTPYLAEFL
ncbi:hypothetical protein ASL14_19055 [Paenibacillus sp. IHB B 3084]|uniref:hypothetical protein n=1 Tax=Paenibacillus sp. IHB B 3084 TaxID=867076 RepID=UPI00071FE7AD|nr:hypothetical protein [Paenibacillus sp. IHB B 3084]ALP37972.1 hypothetical protein ASL14_19055 [Paenibacillus sp. IHB B 3084]